MDSNKLKLKGTRVPPARKDGSSPMFKVTEERLEQTNLEALCKKNSWVQSVSVFLESVTTVLSLNLHSSKPHDGDN